MNESFAFYFATIKKRWYPTCSSLSMARMRKIKNAGTKECFLCSAYVVLLNRFRGCSEAYVWID